MRKPPRRPPDRKVLIGALVLLVMASAFATRAEPVFVQKEVVSLRGF